MSDIERVKEFAEAALHKGEATKFRPIAGFPGYFVSNDGYVVSTKKKNPMFLRRAVTRDGYFRVYIYRENKIFGRFIHRLVLEQFLRPRIGEEQGRHRNGVRSDNRISNLEWGTAKDNADDRDRHGTQPIGINNPKAKLTDDDIRFVRSSALSDTKLGKILGVSKGNIYFIRSGKCWRHVA